jgi:hypothetical protein
MKTTIRDFHSLSQLDGDKTYFDLPVIFEGTTAECHAFCQAKEGYSWRKDSNIFGGYYVDESGKCLMLF